MNKKALSIALSAGMLATSIAPVLADRNITTETIGGSNRYETAINVAKAQNILKFDEAEKGVNNIVLVNGSSLVDGLSASPLAALLKCKVNGEEKAAPLLLSEKDKLNTQTKEYIKSITDGIDKSNVVVNIVGGKSVISENIENELKEMGFYVERFEGKNREDTSIAVAEAMRAKDPNINDVYLVGGNAEADAVSIAPFASNKNINESAFDSEGIGIKTIMPIIVNSKSKGISKTAEDYIIKVTENVKDINNGCICIVGGENIFPEEEIFKLGQKTETSIVTLSGNDRFETNWMIISDYYNPSFETPDADKVVVVKPGKSNKSELIDALTAANYAVEYNAPVFLANEKSKPYYDSIRYTRCRSAKEVVQIGEGVERTVVDYILNVFNNLDNNDL